MKTISIGALLAFATTTAWSQVTVDAHSYTAAQTATAIDHEARTFGQTVNRLTLATRQARIKAHPEWARIPFFLPMQVRITKGRRAETEVQAVASSKTRGPSGINLVFDSSGPYIFSSTEQQLLTGVYTSAQATINAFFGPPATPGLTVHVRNYDAVIGDRQAVAGGYYVSNNGAGQAEIRLPVYNLNEAEAVNFLHCILLAYEGSTPYGYDAFDEGLARAAVMKIVRTPGAMPASLDASALENVLESDYDVLGYYDWYNQRALGGPTFIAPNLLNTPLPESGSLGGVYLLRYLMAGSAWSKILVEYPGFVAAYNQAFYANPALASNVPGLVTLGQSTLNTLAGTSNATIEGLSFSDWFNRQFILETHLTYGNKVLAQPIPITGNLGSGDFGVFLIQANYFSTAATGNETLLSGTCYPIYWDNGFNRESPAVDTTQIAIAAAYGSVSPNFLDLYGGTPYRVTVDVPIGDQLARVCLPAGAIATGTNPSPNDCFGTIEGAPLQSGQTLAVVVNYTGGSQVTIPVTNGAFGTTIGSSGWLAPTRVVLQVVETTGGVANTLLTRVVDKSVGALAIDLRVGGENNYTAPGGLPPGVSTFGLPVDPFGSYAPTLLNLAPSGLLLARYDQASGSYDYFPNMEALTIGHGYFVRVPASQGLTVQGRVFSQFPVSVALEPGWNLVAAPFGVSVPFTQVQAVVAANDPETYASAAGSDLGLDIYAYQPGPVDTTSGVSETGSMVQGTQFTTGQAYFVQCLSPAGATLTFFPSTQISSFNKRFHPAAKLNPQTKGWQVRLQLTDGAHTAPVFLGVNSGAKAGVDLHFSSEMAPGWGGFQAVAVRGVRLYRDVREDSGTAQTYIVELDGLRAGRSYELEFPVVQGKVIYKEVRDGPQVIHLYGDAHYRFTATTGTKTLQVILGGIAQ